MRHRIHRPRSLSAISLAAPLLWAVIAACAGCPGELPPGLVGTTRPDGGGTPPPDYGSWPTPDQKLWKPIDLGNVPPDQGAHDTQAPKPDTKPPPAPDTGVPVGGPCPCGAGLYCIAGACRTTCTPPADACGVDTTCPAQNGCIKTDKAGIWVCMPSTTAGGACSSSVFCPTRHVCGQVNNGPSICLPTCAAAGQGCGTKGGTCLNAGGCLFCSTT